MMWQIAENWPIDTSNAIGFFFAKNSYPACSQHAIASFLPFVDFEFILFILIVILIVTESNTICSF